MDGQSHVLIESLFHYDFSRLPLGFVTKACVLVNMRSVCIAVTITTG